MVKTKNKHPLVVLKNVLAYNTDEDIVSALIQQNGHLMEDLLAEEMSATVRYRRKVRNPHENHVVLEVYPKLWRRLTETGRVYIDVQRVKVMDQTPLVQCSKCLAYGYGRKLHGGGRILSPLRRPTRAAGAGRNPADVHKLPKSERH